MAKYKIGITEAGDAGLDLSWSDKLDSVDGAIVITKYVSPGFRDAVLAAKDKLIVHATVTGFGGSVPEPNVPTPDEEFKAITGLIDAGFPKQKVVIRIDPIVPTPKGIKTAESVFKMFIDAGFSRFRISIIDMYPHVRERFKQAGLPLPYGSHGFYPSAEQVRTVDKMLLNMFAYYGARRPMPKFEGCAEPGLTNVIHCGCVSGFDLSLLGLPKDDSMDGSGYQRRHCKCYSGKTELLESKRRCEHQCLYCYWR